MKFSSKKFSSDTGISEKLASRILEMVYEKELNAEDFSSVLWKLRDWFIKNKMPALVEKLSDDEIGSVIDQIIAERAMWQRDCPRDVCCAETADELEMAFNSLELPNSAWFFNALDFKEDKEYKKGDIVRVQIMRTGTWQHQEYGEVKITKKIIKDIVKNFEEDARGIQLAVDENHEENHKALAWFKELIEEDEGNALFADVELTKKGADLLNEGAYKYFSPEIIFHTVDEESGNFISNLLNGGAFTNRPFFKRMQPLMASEDAATVVQSGSTSTKERHAYFFSHANTMKKLIELMAKLADKTTISASERDELAQVYSELPESDRSDDLNKTFAEILAKAEVEGEEEGDKPKLDADGNPIVKNDEEEETETEEEKPEGEAPAVDGIQANEDGTFEITDPTKFAESVKGIQSLATKLQRDAAVSFCEKTIAPFMFSEKRKDRVVLPKHKKKIVEFAAGLSEKQRTAFFSIIGELKAVPATELGHSKEGIKPDITKPESFTEADPQVQFFMQKMGQDLKTAQQSAVHFYAEKAKQK